MQCTVETGRLFAITGDTSNFPIRDVLVFDVSPSGSFHNMWQLAEAGYSALTIVGQLLASIFFAISMSEKVFSERFNAEKFAIELIKYFMKNITFVVYNLSYFF